MQTGDVPPEVPAGPGAGTTAARRTSAQPRDEKGRFRPTHGGYVLERAWQRGKVPRNHRRLVNRLRFEFALARGYATWASVPAPLRLATDNAIRLHMLAVRLFEGLWRGEEVPKAFYTVSENLRRALSDIGLEPASVGGEPLAAYLKQTYGTNAKERQAAP
jgi:hypothetical protein